MELQVPPQCLVGIWDGHLTHSLGVLLHSLYLFTNNGSYTDVITCYLPHLKHTLADG